MLQDTDFVALARQEQNGRRKIRLLALAHFKDGMSRTTIAKVLKVSRTSVNKWVAAFLRDGLQGLENKPYPGRPAGLNDKQRKQLTLFIERRSQSEQGGRLQGTDVQRYIKDTFGIAYELSNIYRLLQELGFSWVTSRSRHPKQSQTCQDDFKKTPY